MLELLINLTVALVRREKCHSFVAALRKIKFPDMTELWAKMPQVKTDSTAFISEDRDRST